MPYRIEWKDRGVRWIYTGVVTGQEALDSNYEIYSDERFDELKYELVDFPAQKLLKCLNRRSRRLHTWTWLPPIQILTSR